MSIDLSTMSHKQLEQHLEDVKMAIKNAYERDRVEARKAAEKAAAEYGFSLDEVSGGAKYANPEDPSQTWTGKGRQPNWFRDLIASGTDPETLEL